MTQKEIIVEKASQMFVNQGIKAVRMDDIAQELSISKRTLYELFGDKEELIYESISLFIKQGRERRRQQCMQVYNVLEIMLLNLRDMIHQAPTANRMRRNLQRFYPSVYKRLEGDEKHDTSHELRTWIRECIERGYFTKTADSDFVVKVLQSSVNGIMMADRCDIGDAQEVVYMMTYATVVFIRGLCTTKGLEIIDMCFDNYFGNITPSATL